MQAKVWSVVVVAIAMASATAKAEGSWMQAKPMPQGANEVIGAALEGLLYVYGGERMETRHVYGGINLRGQPLCMSRLSRSPSLLGS